MIVNSWRPLTIVTKRYILDVAAALDPPVVSVSVTMDGLDTCDSVRRHILFCAQDVIRSNFPLHCIK